MYKCIYMLPKLPCIYLSTSIVSIDNHITISKMNGMPYIDKYGNYPVMNEIPMICVLQLNMDQIFKILENKKSSSTINKYFSIYPKTGLLQFYLRYSHEFTDDVVYVKYIENYDAKNHNIEKANRLRKIYDDYFKNRGLYQLPHDSNSKVVYITDAVYGIDTLNSSLQSHPQYDSDMEYIEPVYLDEYKKENNNIQIGGFPYFLQGDNEFDENNDVMLMTIVNDLLSFNVSITKQKLLQRKFNKLEFDLSY